VSIAFLCSILYHLKIERHILYIQAKLPLMSNLLKTLGDDWHNPHPYWRLIESLLPASPYIEEIEKCLTGIYVEGHYDYKLYKNTNKYTLYDTDIEQSEMTKKNLEMDMKRESESLEKLCKKMEELQEFLNGVEGYGQALEEDEEEEEVEVAHTHVSRQEKGRQPKALGGKDAAKAKKLEEQKKMLLAKSTKSAMATCQQKLLDMQQEIEKQELMSKLYKGYREADWFYQASMRKIVLKYASSNDLETLIREVDRLLTDYKAMRQRVAPKESCRGEGTGLCETHLLPLYVTKRTEKGVPLVWKCDINC
jgi:hypothetical protein